MSGFLQEPRALDSRLDELADDVRSALREARRGGGYEEVWVEPDTDAIDHALSLVDALVSEARRAGLIGAEPGFARFAGLDPDAEYERAVAPPPAPRSRDHVPGWYRRRWWRVPS